MKRVYRCKLTVFIYYVLIVVCILLTALLVLKSFEIFDGTQPQSIIGKSVLDLQTKYRKEDNHVKATHRHLLVIFTTFDERASKPHHAAAHRIALRNWERLLPAVQPLAFVDDVCSPLAREAAAAHWYVRPLTAYNEHGTPRLKPMFARVFDDYESTFYGYANGDIIFDDELLETLKGVEDKLDQLEDNVMIVGRRHTIITKASSTSIYDQAHLRNFTRNAVRGKAFSIDYFIFTKTGNHLKWNALANVVIGRPLYDNYLVWISLRHGVNVVDATETLYALHLVEEGIAKDGWNNSDVSYNRELIGQSFNQLSGVIDCARIKTTYLESNGTSSVTVMNKTQPVPKACIIKKSVFV